MTAKKKPQTTSNASRQVRPAPTRSRVNLDRDYIAFEAMIVSRVNRDPLFTTATSGKALWDAYLNALPESERQHYTCNACKHFITRYGGLVRLTSQGEMVSLLWGTSSPSDIPGFAQAILAMREAMSPQVTGVFVHDDRDLGRAKDGGWSHLHAQLPRDMVHRDVTLTAFQDAGARSRGQGLTLRVNGLDSYMIDRWD